MEHISNTTEKILSVIEHQHITPRPKWYFVVRNSILWIPGVITTILGAYTIAGLLYGVLHAPEPDHFLLIAAIPLLWVASFFIFSIISTSLLRHTHTGYRHTTVQLLLVSIASSIIIGILFYAITQDTDDNNVRTLYRYPTQHQREYFGKSPLHNILPERNSPLLRIN